MNSKDHKELYMNLIVALAGKWPTRTEADSKEIVRMAHFIANIAAQEYSPP